MLAPAVIALPVAVLLAQQPSAVAPEEPHRVPDLVVTGSRSERARADSTTEVEVIARDEIVATGAASVADVLTTHPGVEVERALRGYTIRLQGLDPEYVLVLVDGERVQGRLGGAVDLARFPVDSIERIEIVKGAGSALYGSDAVAGVVNIITRRAQNTLEASTHLAGGTVGKLDLAQRVGTRRGNYDALLSVGHHRGDGWDLTPATPGASANAFASTHIDLHGGWRGAGGARVSARAGYQRRRQDGVAGNDNGALFDRRTLTEEASLTLTPGYRFRGGSRLELVGHQGFFVDQFASDQRGGDALDQHQKSDELLSKLGAQLDLVLGARHQLTSGTELLHERMRSPRLDAGGRARRQRTRAALYLQHDWRILDRPRLALQPGVRIDGDSQFGGRVSPKVALRFDPHQAVVLRASHGFAYRAPSFQELYIAFDNPGAGYLVGGNPRLAPERSQSLNVAGEWRGSSAARPLLSLGVFRTDIEDLIVVRLTNPDEAGAPSRFSYANVARANTQGLEAGVGAAWGGLDVNLGYALTLARDEEAGRPLEGRARHRGTVRAGYRYAGFSSHARAALVGRRPFYREDAAGQPVTEHAAAHVTLAVRAAQRLGAHVDVFAGAENLLGAGDERHLPIPPRAFYAGVDLRY